MKHKHAELIKAWADGAKLEWKFEEKGTWMDFREAHGFYNEAVYRIKPEPKPDVCVFLKLNTMYGNISRGLGVFDSNIRVTIDGETGQLKSAEVL